MKAPPFEGMAVEVNGPPITKELQRVFGPFSGGRRITGIVVYTDGVHVGYATGLDLTFKPVTTGPDGKIVVAKERQPRGCWPLDTLAIAVGVGGGLALFAALMGWMG